MTKMLYSIRGCCSSIADEHSALQKASGCPPSAPGRSYTLIWAWICVLVIFWYVAAPGQLPYAALRADESCPSTITQFTNHSFAPQLSSQSLAQRRYHYQWIIFQLRTVQACLDRMGLRTLPDATSHCQGNEQVLANLWSHSSCLDINHTCTIPPCLNSFLLPQNHSWI